LHRIPRVSEHLGECGQSSHHISESHPCWELNEGVRFIISFREYLDTLLQIFGKYFGCLFASNREGANGLGARVQCGLRIQDYLS